MNLFKYTNISVTCLEQRVLQIAQIMLSNEWDSITKKCIHSHQKQYKTTFTWTISSNQWKPLKRQSKSSVSCDIFSRSLDFNIQSGYASAMRFAKQSQSTWNQSATRSKSKWNPIQRDLQCLDYNGLLMMIVFKSADNSEPLQAPITQRKILSLVMMRVFKSADNSEHLQAPITQRKNLSLVSSVFDPIGLFAPFSVTMRLLKGIWTKNRQHWDNQVEPGEEAEFLWSKEQLPIAAETSIDRRYFNRERGIKPNFMCLLMHLKTQCVQWPI